MWILSEVAADGRDLSTTKPLRSGGGGEPLRGPAAMEWPSELVSRQGTEKNAAPLPHELNI
jgi:hypothetical protein